MKTLIGHAPLAGFALYDRHNSFMVGWRGGGGEGGWGGATLSWQKRGGVVCIGAAGWGVRGTGGGDGGWGVVKSVNLGDGWDGGMEVTHKNSYTWGY